MTNLVGTSSTAGVPAVEGTDSVSGGIGVHGVNATTYGFGVVGEGGIVGVLGKNFQSGGIGTQGYAYSPATIGVQGWSNASNGSAVDATATGTYAFGVSVSAIGTGSIGVSAAGDYQGGYFNGKNFGVSALGSGYASVGLYCRASGASSNAIQAFGDPTGLAGYFYGDIHLVGYLTKSGGGYRIDHPLDPDNKYLNHHFVESSEMKNMYDGMVILDSSGNAAISMPSYFEAANSDYRYQLTAMGASMPGLFISSKIKDAKFSISGGTAGGEVSWQVTGIRCDAWALKNNPGVEIEKSVDQKGHYMHPELFGFGLDRSDNSAARRHISHEVDEAKRKEEMVKNAKLSEKDPAIIM